MRDELSHGPTWPRRLKAYVAAIAAGWTLVVAASLLSSWMHEQRSARQAAEATARAQIAKDVLYRRWTAGFGGVYAPVSPETPPNPALAGVPERDVVTPSGRRLTLINPAYMTRLVHQLGWRSDGLRGHITSLRPVRPANAPDPWETTALDRFEAGAIEVSSVERVGGAAHLRLMRPLRAEKPCLACHAQQGYREGDVRGGLSVSIPMAPYQQMARRHQVVVGVGHGVLWLLGLTGLAVGAGRAERRSRERDLAEGELRESESLFRNLFAHHAAAKLILDPDTGRIVDANDAAARFYGWSCDELRQMRIQDINTLGPDEVRTEMERARAHNRIHFEFRHRRADGSIRDVEVFSSRIRVREREYLHSIVHDVTERKRAEEALRQSEERFALFMRHVPAVVVIRDAQGRYVYMNEAWEEVMGRARDELLGRTPFECFPREDAERLVADDRRLVERGEAQTVEVELHHASGPRWWLVSRFSLAGADGNPTHVAALYVDITERKRHERELEAARQAAEAANRAKGEFLANMSHEIRTPMNGVVGMTSLLLETDLSDEQRGYARVAQASADALLGVIGDILDFSKIEAGRLELETLDFDLRALLAEVGAALAFRAREKGLAFSCSARPGVPALVRGDPGRLRQILLNLAGNAVKFTHAGEVAVSAGLAGETDGEVLVRFSVRDTGIGIPADKRDRLFQKFSQVDASTTRKYGGTGLGLAICRQLAERMGGEIGVESREGEGSEFWFTARLGKQPQGRAAPAPAAGAEGAAVLSGRFSAPRAAARVLVAEDNAVNQQVLLAMLGRLGVSTDAVGTGVEAIEALRSVRYDLVLMDVQMPEMDGIEAAHRIRDRSSPVLDPGVPIVAVTANAFHEDRERCLAAGMNDYLSKPVDPGALADLLRRWLPGSGGDAPGAGAPAAREEAPLPVFDGAGLLERLAGDRELARLVVRTFLDDVPRQMAALRACLEAGDAREAERRAHTLKGASANVGGEALCRVAREAEKAARADDLGAVRAAVPALERRVEQLREAMEREGW